ncbi:hypothetical protein GL263_18470 [Streptomyces durbertensis]|uniref:Secreted protein n=1 Tax=Streptomyces durbertensis TaxID=2448886 RepID=A0ABR6EJL8_9ACTN|nr:hypothetical protein [Streptomyces durbertensis]MBB1245529.1 hypothetical protein [Streptomyces durbertensis]
MKRAVSVALAGAVLGGVTIAGTSSAQATGALRCDDTGTKIAIIDKKTVWVPTNIHSDWAKPGVKITYRKDKTGTWTATGSATKGAEAGAIIAKASTSFGVSLSKSWSKSDTWSYSATVKKKKGKTKARLMMFHEAKSFTAHKYRVKAGKGGACQTETIYKKPGVTPVKANSNTWGLQYS